MEHTRNTTPDNEPTRLSHPLIVKMGGRQWVVGGDYATPVETELNDKLISLSAWTQHVSCQPEAESTKSLGLRGWWNRYLDKLGAVLDYVSGVPAQLTAEKDQPAPSVITVARKKTKSFGKRRRLRDTFQVGLTFGLALGCVSMLLFHQMEPIRTGSAPSATNHSSPVLTSLSPGFTLPALLMYTLQSGPLASESEAQRLAASLRNQGFPAVVHVTVQPVVWCGISIHAATLNDLQGKLSRLHVKSTVRAVQWSAMTVPGPSSETESSAAQVSRWLSESAGSFRTLVGVLSNGGLNKDAEQAFRTAQSLYPSKSVMDATGHAAELTAFWNSLSDGMKAFEGKHGTQSTVFVLQACEAMAQIQASAASPN